MTLRLNLALVSMLLCADLSADCNALRAITDHVVSATLVDPGAATEYCVVEGSIPPAIRFTVILPTNWNGRFLMRGNGGYAGRQPTKGFENHDGYAVAYTDTGHDAKVQPLATFAYNNRAAEIDYAYRAVHLTAVNAKRLIERYYGRASEFNYWSGCSTGGRQGLMSAQRFPADFDGIVAGAPVLNFTDTQISGVWAALALREAPVNLDKLQAVGRAIYAKCDRLDGLQDGLIDDPRNCSFDPVSEFPRCGSDDHDNCLTDAEAETLRKIYTGVVSNGKPYFPGQPLGAELGDDLGSPLSKQSGWGRWYVNPQGSPWLETFGTTFMRYMAFTEDDPKRRIEDFDFDSDPAKMDDIRQILDATDPDLGAFKARGGKMIMYFGWADTALNPLMGVNYYESVLARDPHAADFYRLFMVPGMFHCSGGRGVYVMDVMSALVDWVETDAPPERIVARRGATGFTRPLCPYPQIARYDGRGNAADAGSFACGRP